MTGAGSDVTSFPFRIPQSSLRSCSLAPSLPRSPPLAPLHLRSPVPALRCYELPVSHSALELFYEEEGCKIDGQLIREMAD